ncbi:MAG: hypothetical protein LUD27_00390, partial [Clostridia bacterium]|nr:hypothetical protein [Clostridia bacterium]
KRGLGLSFFSGIAGLICSVIGYKKVCECGGKGKPFAIAGITISIIRIVCVLTIVILYVLAILGLFVIAAAWGAG